VACPYVARNVPMLSRGTADTNGSSPSKEVTVPGGDIPV